MDLADSADRPGAPPDDAAITRLPSIPERSTFRVPLPPNEVLPPRK